MCTIQYVYRSTVCSVQCTVLQLPSWSDLPGTPGACLRRVWGKVSKWGSGSGTVGHAAAGAHFLTSSLSHFLTSSLSHFLTFSLPYFLTSSLPHFLTSSLSHFLTSSLSQFLQQSWPKVCDAREDGWSYAVIHQEPALMTLGVSKGTKQWVQRNGTRLWCHCWRPEALTALMTSDPPPDHLAVGEVTLKKIAFYLQNGNKGLQFKGVDISKIV